jgi:HD-GYP domain-containing protein (c-di-GMP phosphodiesterase class II)
MIKRIKTKELDVGMYVVMPAAWLDHPFAKNSFSVKSRRQLQKIIDSGFDEVDIDTSKGMPIQDYEEVSHGDAEINKPRTWEPEKLVPAELMEALHDTSLPVPQKAKIVYKSSVQLMTRLMDDPKVENIRVAKKAIADIVDMILEQEDTTNQLLRITSHDFYTYTHCVNVGILSIMLSKKLFKNSYAHDMHELGAGFFLHDLGKVRVDPGIINKPGRLTDEEMQTMRIHPYQGYLMLKESGQITEECSIIVLQHHERENGTGYPKRLRGDEIHAYGRICCIADVFDALTAERSYKANLTAFQALKIMKEEMLDHFHKDVFGEFVMMFSRTGNRGA